MRKLTLITLALVIFLSGCTSIDDSEEVNIENQIENEDESKEENYEELRYLGDNTYTAKLESSYGVIDKEKNILIPFEFENIQAKDDEYYIANKNGKVGITTEESVILEYNYDSIREADGIYFIKKDGKIGIFNTENKEVIEPKYDMALPVSENKLSPSVTTSWLHPVKSINMIITLSVVRLIFFILTSMIKVVL